jgi:WD40 repeat protein
MSFVFFISACQNSPSLNSSQTVHKSSIQIKDSNVPLTVIGGELNYELANSINSNYKLYGVKFNPKNNTIIAYGDSSKITIYNLQLNPIASEDSKNDEINSIAISLDGNYLVSGGDDGYIEIWDLNNYQLLHRLKGNSDDIYAVAISSDNKKVASGGEDKVIDIWDLNSGEQLARLKGHQKAVTNISFIDFNRKIVSTGKDNQVKIWNVMRKNIIYSYLAPSNEYGEIQKAVSFDNYTILALTEVERAEGNSRKRNGPPVWKYTIKFKDNQGNTLKEFNQHRETITDIAVANNRAYMATSSKDKTVRLWDLNKKKHITNIVLKDRGNSVSINKSGHLLVALEGKNRIKLFQIENSYDPSINPSKTSSAIPVDAKIDKVPSLYNKQYAIVIGINHYKNLSLPRLTNAVNDARSVAKLLRKKGFSVIELYNENATKEKILDALKRVKQLAGNKDATLFYFAGHGDGVSGHNNVREGYILPYDFNSDLDNPNPDVMYYDKSAISISSLVMYARDTKAKHIGIVLDSCFSGLAMDSKYAKKSLSSSSKNLDSVEYDSKTRSVRIKPTNATIASNNSSNSSNTNANNETLNLFKKLLSKKSINILTAGDDQPVSDGSNHSPFTQALLKALSSNTQKGYVRFSTLAEYIRKYVESKTNNRQKPQYKNESEDGGDFIFKI